jgi:hypothetical protein
MSNDLKRSPEELEAIIKTITDGSGLTDDLMSGKKVLLFMCTHSGLYFPSDYLKEWGRKYGHGLGASPVSECLETLWEHPVANPKNLRSADQIMYPVGHHYGQVDAVIMPAAEAKTATSAIFMIEDPYMELRSRIIREKQMKNPNGRLKASVNSRGL